MTPIIKIITVGAVVAATSVTQSTSSLVVIAIIAMFGAILAATIPIVINGRQNRKMRKEDWERQDAVALAAEHVADRAAEAVVAAEKVAKEAKANADAQRKESRQLNARLTQIAHQTDGLYTAALESELRALQGMAATLREVVALRDASNSELDNSRTLAVITQSESRIAELEQGLVLRRKYQESLMTRPVSDLEQGPLQVEVVNPDPVDVAIVLPRFEDIPAPEDAPKRPEKP